LPAAVVPVLVLPVLVLVLPVPVSVSIVEERLCCWYSLFG
jgi:hypothetical protein